MRPGAFAGIDTVATIHPVSSMLIASMRPGANRRELAASAVREMRTDRAAGQARGRRLVDFPGPARRGLRNGHLSGRRGDDDGRE